jgi:uncharacterized membrane protein
MNSHAIQSSQAPAESSPRVRSVDLAAPLQWLKDGVRDCRAAPLHSLAYGALFTAAAGIALALSIGLPWFTTAFLTGLLLIGPYLAAGLYVAARQMESGEPVRIRAALRTLADCKTNMALFGLFLAMVMVAWVRLSALLFAIQFTTLSPSIGDYTGILRGHFDPVVMAYFFGIGFLLAVTVFITSAVAVPLIIDRNRDPFTAIRVSARAVVKNWPAMTLWAALIVVLTLVGILTLGLGMLVLFPILGYATWHSYRALVE